MVTPNSSAVGGRQRRPRHKCQASAGDQTLAAVLSTLEVALHKSCGVILDIRTCLHAVDPDLKACMQSLFYHAVLSLGWWSELGHGSDNRAEPVPFSEGTWLVPATRTTMEAADGSPLGVSPRAGSWRRTRPWSRSSSIGRSGSSCSIEYTSLRDVLEEECCGGGGGGWSAEYSCHDIHDLDPSNIGIRNQLLKHAASAYLQSAVVVAAGRDEGCCLARLWRRVGFGFGCGNGGCGGGAGGGGTGAGGGGGGRRGRGGRGRVLMRACSWQGCVDDPAAFVARSARRLAAFLAGRVGAVWPSSCRWNSSPRAEPVAYKYVPVGY